MKCCVTSINVFYAFQLQKHDADLMFEDGINSLSDDKSSNHLSDSSRTKVVSKRSVSDDSDKQKVELSQSQSDEGWWSRAKRSFKNLFWKSDEKIVEKREIAQKTTKSPEKLVETQELSALRRRREFEDDEDDDDDNEIGSGDDATSDNSTPFPDPVTPLPPVKDDKYCEKFYLFL